MDAPPSAGTSLPSVRTPRASQEMFEMALRSALPIMVIVTSTSLIRSNQYLMQEGRFSYPFFLVLMHCISCSLLALTLLWLRPSLYPALTDPRRKAVILSSNYYLSFILPIALCFCFSLVLSNVAYAYCSVAFLQMIKEGNIIVIYCLSVLSGIEQYSHTQTIILCVMVAATWFCVDGELNFSPTGCVVQVTAGFCEAVKTIFQKMVLAGKGTTLDPMSTVLVVMPMSGLLLMAVLGFHHLVMDLGFVKQPSFEEIWLWKSYLVFNILNSFILNVVIAVFLQHLSPVSYILTGNIKDICVVVMSALVIHEMVSKEELMGFSVQVLCVVSWTAYKQQQYQYRAQAAPETQAQPAGKLE